MLDLTGCFGAAPVEQEDPEADERQHQAAYQLVEPGLPSLLSQLALRLSERFRHRGIFRVVDNAFLDSYSISLHDRAATYARMLRDLPPGLNEWAIHPA